MTEEKEALMSLYQNANGAKWHQQEGWNTSRPLDEWWGISLHGDGPVRSIDLTHNNLGGTIAPELERLQGLERLDLSNNDLEGEIPPALARIPTLRTLLLTVNQLSGKIPAALGGHNALEELALDNNQLEGEIPRELGDCPNLRGLFLSSCGLQGQYPQGWAAPPAWCTSTWPATTSPGRSPGNWSNRRSGNSTWRATSCPAASRRDCGKWNTTTCRKSWKRWSTPAAPVTSQPSALPTHAGNNDLPGVAGQNNPIHPPVHRDAEGTGAGTAGGGTAHPGGGKDDGGENNPQVGRAFRGIKKNPGGVAEPGAGMNPPRTRTTTPPPRQGQEAGKIP